MKLSVPFPKGTDTFSVGNRLIDFLILFLVLVFILGFFDPRYLLSATITTGGDTGSHYNTAVYLKEVLLPHGQIMGWMQGNYAGFPLFYHYFPLPFVLITLLSYLMPMQIAFKLVTVLGTFLLPLCLYAAFRLLKYPFPIPALGAILTLPFLFMEANSMWGANIPSTLAGEFSYSLGISLAFLFFGTLYAGIRDKNKLLLNAGLVLAMLLSHGYAIIFAGIIGSFFLFTRQDFLSNLKYLLAVFGLGTLLAGFWLLPFISTLPYVTEYVTAWQIKSILEVLPRIILPFVVISLGAFFLNAFDRRSWYFAYNFVVCLILYFLGPRVGVLDIRFIPILQIFIVVFGATLPLVFLGEIKQKQLLPAIALLVIALWTVANVGFIKSWVAWNYSGFEGKKTWPLFQQINNYLSQSRGGRVVYEHSPLHNGFGTERAFESLPLFAKRNTLEGLYMQSSPSSPFIFYIQSEVSKVCSGPFPQYRYTKLNLPAALAHLKMFNVSQYIVRSPEAKQAAAAVKELRLEKRFGDYEIYRLTTNDGHYVQPLRYQPVFFRTANWKRDFFDWFINYNSETPYLNLGFRKDAPTSDNLLNLPKVPTGANKAVTNERLKDEEISFDTTLIGYPHLVKISYHPNWQVEGADKIYLVSPSFMLVYPQQNHVRLYFGKTWFNHLGGLMTLAGLAIAAIFGIISFIHGRQN